MLIRFNNFLLKLKRIQFPVALVFIFASYYSNAQSFEDARSYITFIDSHNAKVVSQTWNYMEMSTNSEDQIAIKGQRKKLENIVKSSLRTINNAAAFDQNLQKAAMNYLEGNLKIIKNELIHLIDLKNEKVVSVDQIALIQKIRKAIVQLRTDYDLAIKNYGSKYELELVPNDGKLARQMANTIALYDYYYSVQIEFSKLQIIEQNLWNGINDKTLSSLNSDMLEAQQNLLTITTIDNLGLFKEDNSLIKVLLLMNSHIKEALDDRLNAIIIIKKDQETGNRDQIMTKTKNYNASLKWANQNRKSIYNQWNSVYPKFLKTHINAI